MAKQTVTGIRPAPLPVVKRRIRLTLDIPMDREWLGPYMPSSLRLGGQDARDIAFMLFLIQRNWYRAAEREYQRGIA